MSRFAALAVSQRSVVLLLAVALFVAGISAWTSLKQELLPDVDFPVITIVAPYPGAGATDVADQVAEPIERAVQNQPRLEELQSTSASSIALVVAQFSFGTNVDETRDAIAEALNGVGLPESVEPQVQALNINASPVVIASLAATSEAGLDAAANVARDEIVPEILGLEGVATADLTGGLERQLVIVLDRPAVVGAGLSVERIVGLLQANSLTIPAGELETDGGSIPVSAVGRFESVEQISGLVVGARPPSPDAPQAPPTPITLGELATIEVAEVATTGYARTALHGAAGAPALTLTVTKTSDANTVRVAEAVRQTLLDIEARHSGAVDVEIVSDLSTFILESQDGLLKEGGLGALFAVLTIFLFLFSLRSTLVAAISIPLSVLTALVLMQVADISLNVMTLGGLAVAVGRVVDDSIVVLENIFRHRALGDDRLTAVIRGPSEVARAITASTLTTVAVFLPIGFVGGIVSQLFLPFALTVTFALLASLVVSLTVIPVLAYLFIGRVRAAVDETGAPRSSLWVRAYTPAIQLALRNRLTRWGVLVVSFALFVASLGLVAALPTQFINTGSEKILQVTLIPPAGQSSEQVLERAIDAEAILLGQPDVEVVQTSVPGEGDTGYQTIVAALQGVPANSATLTVRLDPSVELDEATLALSGALEPVKTDGYDTAVTQAAGFTSNNLNIIVSAPDRERVAEATQAVLDAIEGRADLANLKSDLVAATPEIVVRVDPARAAAVGSSAAQIGAEVRAVLSPTTVPNVVVAAEQGVVPVVVRYDAQTATSVEALGQLMVGTLQQVPLSAVATVEQVDVQGSITRINGAPAAQVTAEVLSEDTGAVSGDIQDQIDRLAAEGRLADGVAVELAGVTQQQNEAFGGLYYSMAVAILLVYVMMVLAFNSLVTPFIILFSLPLATIGAFPALYLTDRPIGVSALIGFLMLIGIVVTNAIVLLDLVERLRAQGHSARDALIEGGRTRVRPILMTAFATILALIPLAAGFNEGSIIAAELGTVVIGGLFSSTLLTLLVVPVAYSLVEGGRDRVRGWFGRAPQAAPVTPAALAHAGAVHGPSDAVPAHAGVAAGRAEPGLVGGRPTPTARPRRVARMPTRRRGVLARLAARTGAAVWTALRTRRR